MKIIVTGGAGFIGSALVRYIIEHTSDTVINIDKLTYAGSLDSLTCVVDHPRHIFEKIDICSSIEINRLFTQYQPDMIIHLAAESHVDRSIQGPGVFIQTNIIGTFTLLEAARTYWQSLPLSRQQLFRFHHVSTDEVFGDLGSESAYFTENSAYAPSSPYSASKASSDHLVRAWYRTYGLPILITNCSNNYGPYQYPEKFIPVVILNALAGRPIPIYGDGKQIRDWLYVEDHVRAIYKVAKDGVVGETYNIGSNTEKTNMEIVLTISDILEELAPLKPAGIESYSELVNFVCDRPGHDRRYAIDSSKIQNELGFVPQESYTLSLRKTVQWYIDNSLWCQRIYEKKYQHMQLGLGESEQTV